ncbi:hypothetical protein [Solwaraspora sp. WMMD792]|uniref:hypothetical protein n=1 Tax=Solwaraspora sp. WMMD792 TaxID=3016099 RepID=UPI00241621FD|nr:hypothetical protein [Solwaraspora sp. WMMD792]MDG4768748.1 hypothetical protein [Solwaraspora sp. WMMD792]MDG4768787.1 hypothetical protein [Solwaraspora sp. WMMD792]MDG4768827.1 hypothetical protein [Solwaraspora sp. WMMD792]MDG4768857.1 hypothetical protein [Solwaraspora sp. WMMD792]MDG4768890.1 hypothetical protein [Solwaraspora sp. WMMD792]
MTTGIAAALPEAGGLLIMALIVAGGHAVRVLAGRARRAAAARRADRAARVAARQARRAAADRAWHDRLAALLDEHQPAGGARR